MSNNFVAVFSVNGNVDVKFHVGSTTGGRGAMTVQGDTFPTVDIWKAFLTHNKDKLFIQDEDGKEYDVQSFLDVFFTESGSENQIGWLEKNGYTIHDTPQREKDTYWVDEGFLFYNGWFS